MMLESETLLGAAIASFRSKPAYIAGDSTLFFDDLAQLIGSPEFAAIDIAGARVVVILPDGAIAYLMHVLLFLKQAVHIPLSTKSSSDRIAAIIASVKPHILVTTSALASRYAGGLSSQPAVIVLDDGGPQAGIDGGVISALAATSANLCAEPTTVRYIMFTSGSTGEPKGVCLSAANIMAAALMNVRSLGLDSLRRSVIGVPHFDYYGLIQFYSHAVAGACVVYGGRLIFPKDIEQRLAVGVTDLVTVPFGLAHIVRQVRQHKLKSFGALAVITSSSDMLTDQVLAEIFDLNPTVKVFDIYGLTEAGRACFNQITRENCSERTLGRPAEGVTIRLNGMSISDSIGEIVIVGPNVMVGYFRGVEGEHLLIKNYAEMRTGDLGVRVDGGGIKLIGRIGHMINIRGYKIHPIEIESIATSFAGVLEARASRCEIEGEARIRLELVVGENDCFDEGAVLKSLQCRLPLAFVPAEIKYHKTLQRTEIGSKLMRQVV
jgi:long-chain acyl-CoA synthetase